MSYVSNTPSVPWVCTCNPGFQGCDGPTCHVDAILEREEERDRFARSLEGLSDESFHEALAHFDKEAERGL